MRVGLSGFCRRKGEIQLRALSCIPASWKRDGVVFEVVGELGVDDFLDDLRWEGEEGDRAEVFEVVEVILWFLEEGLNVGVLPAVRDGGGVEGKVDDFTKLGGDGGEAVGVGGVVGGGVWRRCGVEAVVDGSDFLVEKSRECVAEFLGWWDVVDVGAGVGELLHDAEEFLAVVRVVVKAFCEVGAFGESDKLVVLAGGFLVGC
ncbi:hypothetical protein NDU88_004452 [Pleurodeles waltl]|uniref:Uncharacterized protein n=1 Tax=Pleurodeles waltl TaxID=8319 RepID=A0AAV7SIU0_PLEWA|nr:hypothetical protein NDU88_004452 [Pleurodeles waltl]